MVTRNAMILVQNAADCVESHWLVHRQQCGHLLRAIIADDRKNKNKNPLETFTNFPSFHFLNSEMDVYLEVLARPFPSFEKFGMFGKM